MEKSTPLISVIVPVYNVAPYVRKCLDSLLAQTYSEIEIIVVDDASTDESGSICDTYPALDKRIQVIHFPVNRGLSAARNDGICRAKGLYAAFVDSDDYVEPDFLEKLYDNLIKNKTDISICGIDGLSKNTEPPAVYSNVETARCLARRTPFLWNTWGKLFPTALVKATLFDKRALCCEDLLFFYKILRQIKTVSYFPDSLYHYVYRDGSEINNGIDEKRCTVFSVIDYILKDASANFPETVSSFRQLSLDANVRLAMQAVEGGTARGELWMYLKRFHKNVRRSFSREALLLCPHKKGIIAELMLYASPAAFFLPAVFYRLIKHLKGKN